VCLVSFAEDIVLLSLHDQTNKEITVKNCHCKFYKIKISDVKIQTRFLLYIQGDFESCVDILTCDRTPQKVTIELIMPYTNVDIFREKGAKVFQKKFGSH
jgi:hypothetical protein